MKILNKILTIITFSILFILISAVTSNAGYQRLDNLDFTVDIEENGDMRITEIWNVYVEDTNTLFKTFPVDKSYDSITDVTVSKMKNGSYYDLSKSYSYAYHVTKDYYQALTNPDGDFEIAWGVSISESETNTYKISYTVKNHITLYNDCAEMYWQLIGKDFDVNARNITGTINLPYGIIDIDDLKVWAHGPLNGTIERVSTNQVSFQVDNLNGGTYLEIRIATPSSIFENSYKREYINKLDSIIEEETIWANEANALRQRQEKFLQTLKIVVSIVIILLIIFNVCKMLKYSRILGETKKQEPEQELDYFRDIPNESVSPAEASFLYYFSKGKMTPYMSKILSATMLNVCLKGWLEFEIDPNDKKKVMVILKESGKNELNEDEKLLYNYLKFVSKNTLRLTMKDFEKYSKSHTSDLQRLLKNIGEEAEKTNVKSQNYDLELEKQHNKWVGLNILFFFILILAFGLIGFSPLPGMILILSSVINIVIVTKITKRINGLTQKGINEKEQWEGLYKFMKDFSMLDEREVPELVLWEKYLVYATAFGIADKVLKQLKVRFPELQDEQYMRTHFAYMHIACNPHTDFNFIDSMSNSIGSSVNYSSGGGAGGGFSGGGGGGRWWRRRRRPLNHTRFLIKILCDIFAKKGKFSKDEKTEILK